MPEEAERLPPELALGALAEQHALAKDLLDVAEVLFERRRMGPTIVCPTAPTGPACPLTAR
jgi:hypothetical protein